MVRRAGDLSRDDLSCRLILAGEEVGCDVSVWAAGPDVLTFTTCSAAVDLELTSTYTGGDNSELLVSELVRWSNSSELRSRMVSALQARPLTYERRFALLDHLAAYVSEAAELSDRTLRFEGVEEAIEELEVGV